MRSARGDATIAAGVLALLGLAFVVFWPAMHGGFIWDDGVNIYGNPVMGSTRGLLDIWLAREGAFDYYPLTWTTWWLEWQASRKNTFPYHVLNVVLHAATAAMLWRVLVRLGLRGAFFAALLFLVHPVNVESVAWISERKNTLSMLMLAISLALYLDSKQADSARRTYWGSVVFFGLALLAKPSVVLIPVVLLCVEWWRRGALTRLDLWKVVPFGLLSVMISIVTILVHHARGIENAVVRPEGFLSRLAGVGWCVWFYLGKLLWPADIAFVYPRWKVDPMTPSHWVPLVALVATFGVLFFLRRRVGRGPVVALACYVALLFPVLGFIDIYFFRYAFVADHWQYPACIAVFSCIAGICGAVIHKLGRAGIIAGSVIACAIVVVLGARSWREAHHYESEAVLWAAAAKANPTAPMALNNYAATNLWPAGRYEEAREVFRRAIELDPQFCEAYVSLGGTYPREKNYAEAIAWYRKALNMPAGEKDPRIVLGDTYRELGDLATALSWYEQALARSKRRQDYWFVLPSLYESVGDMPRALERYRANAEATPNEMEPWFRLGYALARQGQQEQAREAFAKAREQAVDHVELHSMGLRLLAGRQFEPAVEMLQHAIREKPDYGSAHNKLGEALEGAGRRDEAIKAYQQAIVVQPGFREAKANLDRLQSTASQTRPAT